MSGFRKVNEIKVSHREKEIGRSGLIVQFACVDCGRTSEVLDLDSYDESELNEFADSPSLRLAELSARYRQVIVDGTKYDNIEDLISDLSNVNHDINICAAKELPLGLLEKWAKKRNKKYRRRVLLEYLQGPVCNRCGLVFDPSRLTIDHIIGNRSRGELSNLQLLCENCHTEKNKEGNSPTERDISPFNYDGKQRIHTISCIEFSKTERLQPLEKVNSNYTGNLHPVS